MSQLSLFALAFVALALGAHYASLALAYFRCRPVAASSCGRRDAPTGPRHEPISLVRPLCGLEPFSQETIDAAFRVEWPCFELIFCVADADDPVIAVVERAIAAHPDVNARLLVADERWCLNPKLNNMTKGFRAARYDWIVFTDSNVLTPPDYVRRLFAAWTPDAGMVSAPPAGAAPVGFWAHVECAMLNTWQTRVQYAVDSLGFGFAQGKTLFFRRADLENGGFEALADDPAEDAAATKLVRGRGKRVRLAGPPFPQMLGPRTAAQVWARHLRWARLRRVSFPHLFLAEIVAGALPPSLVLASVMAASGETPALALVLFAVAWYAPEALLARAAGWPLGWAAPVTFLVRDGMLPALWVAALCGRAIVWRGASVVPERQPRVAGARPWRLSLRGSLRF